MIKAIWAGNTVYSKFLISVGIILLSATLFTLLGSLTASFILGINMEELKIMLQNTTHPQSVTALKIMQTFSAIGAFIVPPFLLAYLFNARPIHFLALDKGIRSSSMLIVFIIMIMATPFINFLGELNAGMHLPGFLKGVEDWMKASEMAAADLTKAFLDMTTPMDLIINLFIIALLPAIGEELLFRGIIQRLFHQWSRNAHVAVWTSAILFSAMHMQFYGFFPRMILGGMLGYMFVWSGSLWLPILAHFINNAAAVILIYMYKSGVSGIDPDKIGTGNESMAAIISLGATAILFAFLYNQRVVGVKFDEQKIENLN